MAGALCTRTQRCGGKHVFLAPQQKMFTSEVGVGSEMGWEKVECMEARHDCTNVFKALASERCPVALRDMFRKRSDVSARSTRSTDAGDLHLPKCRLAQTRKGFKHRAVRAWNVLPPSVKDTSSRRAFTAALGIYKYRIVMSRIVLTLILHMFLIVCIIDRDLNSHAVDGS